MSYDRHPIEGAESQKKMKIITNNSNTWY